MKKQKLSIEKLSIQSFVTHNEKARIQGGKTTVIVYTDECKLSDWCIDIE